MERDWGYTMEELVTEYEGTKGLIKDVEEGALIVRGENGYTDLESVLPEAKEKIRKDLEVYLIDLRTQIRERLEEDERQQLKLMEPVEEKADPAAALPKNDYRRHQNGTENELEKKEESK